MALPSQDSSQDARNGASCVSAPQSVCHRFDRLGFDQPERTFRLGIMGGTFDPIHIGHLSCAEQARVAFGLDAVVFMPAGTPVFKLNQQVTDAQARLDMCRLATASNPFFDVSPLEVEREGNTYTVDTLCQLRAYYPPNVELYFITGADAVLSIVKWRESERIADLAHLIAVTRPGAHISDAFKSNMAEMTRFDINYLEVPALSISSSMLRRFVREGNSIRYLVTYNVFDYICRHGLYSQAGGGGE